MNTHLLFFKLQRYLSTPLCIYFILLLEVKESKISGSNRNIRAQYNSDIKNFETN